MSPSFFYRWLMPYVGEITIDFDGSAESKPSGCGFVMQQLSSMVPRMDVHWCSQYMY